jgi:hypothetical protein
LFGNGSLLGRGGHSSFGRPGHAGAPANVEVRAFSAIHASRSERR